MEDLLNAKYVDHSYWNELTDGTQRVKDGAAAVLQGKKIFGVGNEGFEAAAVAIEKGEEFPPLILIAHSMHSTPRLLEGHLRATAYGMAQNRPQRLRTIFGISPAFDA